MPFKIQQMDQEYEYKDVWTYPRPQNYHEWIEEYERLCKEFPADKFRLVKYTFDVVLSN